jgi:hypothetical protein
VVRVAADHQVAVPPVAVRQVVDHRAVQEPKVARDLAALVEVVHRADRKAAHRVGLAANPVRVRNQVHSQALVPARKVVASHRDPVPDLQVQVVAELDQAALVQAVQVLAANHPVEAPAAARDPVDQARAPVPGVDPDPAELDPVVSVARGNRMDRAVQVVARQAAVVPVRRAVVVARATTSGMESAGCRSQFPIRALLPKDRLKLSVFVRAISQRVQARMWGRPFTQDASKVCNE